MIVGFHDSAKEAACMEYNVIDSGLKRNVLRLILMVVSR